MEVEAALGEAPHRWIDVGHCEIACWSFGQGPALVFVHGWPLHAATWRAHVPLLADRFTCHLIDLPGIGKTRWDADTRFGIHAHADTVLAIIDALDLTEYALIAHDSGATITRLVASRDTRRARALVMGDTELPNHRLPVFEISQKLAKLPGSDWMMRKLFDSKMVRRNSSVGLGGSFKDIEFGEGDFKRYFIDPLVADGTAMKGQMNFARSVDWSFVDELPEVHAKIQAPVLMVWGDADEIFPLEGARKMIDQFPSGARLEVVPGAKLFVHEEFPDTFVSHAGPFLDEIFGLN